MQCRLCEGLTEQRFSRRASDGSEICYFECLGCGSLQTERPYWLQEAYREDALSTDTFTAERALFNRMVVYFIFKICGLSQSRDKLLDWGGGRGLLVRMLRDIAIDAYHYDKHQKNVYASAFDRQVGTAYRFVTSFEVWEHFVDPKLELDEIFSMAPDYLLISTCLYRNQDQNWSYLTDPKGQHIFFYADRAMRFIASRYGYHVVILPSDLVLFHRGDIRGFKLRILSELLARPHFSEILFALKRKWSLSSQDKASILNLVDTRRS